MNKESRPEKKAWQKPELTVLVRSEPEEAVLAGCKAQKVAGDTALQHNKCYAPHGTSCSKCTNLSVS